MYGVRYQYMSALFFSHNGELKRSADAAVSLFDINYAYGYGVYETLKLRRGIVYFPDQHCDRLHHSAKVVGIQIPWSSEELVAQIRLLASANKLEDANIKIMSIGDSRGAANAELNTYILMLNPLFPSRRLYAHGCATITAHGERHFPTAKTLDMLLSAVLYRRARAHDAYDALLINTRRCVSEGTRTNVFVTDGTALFTPPHDQTLFGVTKKSVIECAATHGIPVHERELPWDRFGEWQGVFLTSTSSKIVPVVKVDGLMFDIPPLTKALITHYSEYLMQYAKTQQRV